MGCCGWSHKRQSKTFLPTTYVGCEQICHVSLGMSRFKSLKTAVATDNVLLFSDLTFWQIHRWRPAWFLVEKEQMRDIKKNWQHDLIPWPHNHFGMAPFCSSPPNSALRTLQKEICHISNLHLNTTQNYGFLTFPIYICTQLKLNIFQSTFAHNSRFPIYICTQLKWKILDFSDFQRPFTCKVPMVCTRNFHLEWRNCEW